MYANNRTEICPIYDTLKLFNRKWVIAITMDLFSGCTHFYDFKNKNPEISNQVLSQTLQFMESHGLIYKELREYQRNRTEYYLTEKGKKLNQIFYNMMIYSIEELNFSKLKEHEKEEIKKEYEECLFTEK